MRISVVGGGTGTEEALVIAEEVGETIASRGHTLVCGGRTGVMEAACRGAQSGGGRTIGILPGAEVSQANPYVDVPIVTNLGDARNVLVVLNGEGVIAIDGRYGTLSEIALALKVDRPVVGIDTHDVEGLMPVNSAEEAVLYLEKTVPHSA